MLPAKFRLRDRTDFERLRHEGRTFAGKLMVISVAPNAFDHNRYGVVVTRKFGSAVHRNRARRVVRASLASLHLQLISGYDMVVIVRQSLSGKGVTETLPEMTHLLRQAGLVAG